VVQCLTHLLLNGTEDADGIKNPLVCACESDTNGALTMRILHLLSNGQPVALMDVRMLDCKTGKLILANCGAIPEDMLREPDAPVLSGCTMCRHIFGKGGGGGFSGTLRRGEVTIARLCVRNQKYWMAISKGISVDMLDEERSIIPRTFPSAMINTNFDGSFLKEFGSNHLHIVFGDYTEEIMQLCSLLEIDYRLW
jgi:L-fucose isomerase